MNEEQIRAVIEAAIEKSAGLDVWQIVLLIIVSSAAAFFGAYLKEKAKATATKEDIEDITRKIESVRGDISRINAVEEQKRKLKYEACLEALTVIDSHFSQLFAQDNPTPQLISTVKAREVHSKLILSCSDVLIVEKFGEIFFGPRDGYSLRPPTDLLNEFRNLIRKELGFGEELALDRDRAWIARAAGDPEAPVVPPSTEQ